jgi:hypothetical protein
VPVGKAFGWLNKLQGFWQRYNKAGVVAGVVATSGVDTAGGVVRLVEGRQG